MVVVVRGWSDEGEVTVKSQEFSELDISGYETCLLHIFHPSYISCSQLVAVRSRDWFPSPASGHSSGGPGPGTRGEAPPARAPWPAPSAPRSAAGECPVGWEWSDEFQVAFSDVTLWRQQHNFQNCQYCNHHPASTFFNNPICQKGIKIYKRSLFVVVMGHESKGREPWSQCLQV